MFVGFPALTLGVAAQLAVPVREHRGTVEVTSQISIAGGYRLAAPPRGSGSLFSLAVRVDVLFGRAGPGSIGLGPFASTRSDNFADLATAVGASLLLPTGGTFPFVLSVGGVGRYDSTGLAFGAIERLWWGARSYNYHSTYVLSAGFFVESRQFADPDRTVDIIAGVDVDLEIVVIPYLLLYNWLFRHGQDGR